VKNVRRKQKKKLVKSMVCAFHNITSKDLSFQDTTDFVKLFLDLGCPIFFFKSSVVSE
jgi:hypothetical protein